MTRHTIRFAIAALALVLAAAPILSAHADDRRWHHDHGHFHHYHHYHHDHGYYGPAYAPDYAPPPVVYGAPSLNVVIPLR